MKAKKKTVRTSSEEEFKVGEVVYYPFIYGDVSDNIDHGINFDDIVILTVIVDSVDTRGKVKTVRIPCTESDSVEVCKVSPSCVRKNLDYTFYVKGSLDCPVFGDLS